MERLVEYFIGCGYTEQEAVKEAESMIRYHTTGADAVSREYAIEMLLEELELI